MTGRTQAILEEAVALPQADRAPFLDRACAGDPALRGEVEALLGALDAAARKGFLGAPTAGAPPNGESATASVLAGPTLREGPGTRIGPYKLLQAIGEGGFGTVFMAEQEEPVRRRVALKIIKLGMDTRQVIARFEAERQALAMMDHPNIAKVFDAGATETGRPYFVMELVKGIPITEHCDRENLSTRERLELFAQVCQAVQHAHSKGIIHRDIKPGNVLVTITDSKPVPKVIDFGIAKATSSRLTEKTLFTEHRQLIGTPEYMSPEQAEMSASDIDTRSDVYSLGVLLYQLLTGSTPFDPKRLRSAAFGEIQRIIREEEPPRPSTRVSALGDTLPAVASHRRIEPARLGRLLRGDLDWIVMKALEKDRTRRYETASAMAQDVERHLRDQPVLAGPPGGTYRLRKFARRHRLAVGVGVVVGVALLLGAIGISTGLVWALREREIALSARRDAEYQALLANIAGANVALRDGDVVATRQRLNAVPERLRNWEWRQLDAASDNAVAVLSGHDGWVNSGSFSPDGTRVVTASLDGTARIWDAHTGAPIRTITWQVPNPTAKGVHLAVFSPDGSRLLLARRSGGAAMWDAAAGTMLARFDGLDAMNGTVTFSPDGSRVFGAGSTGAGLWDTSSGQAVRRFDGVSNGRAQAALSRDGRRVLVFCGADAPGFGELSEWDADSGKELSRHSAGLAIVQAIRYDAQGPLLLCELMKQVGPTNFHGTGLTAVRRADGTDVATFSSRGGGTQGARFSPDGSLVLTWSYDKTGTLWNASTGAEVATIPMTGQDLSAFSFSPDSRLLAVGAENGGICLYDAATGRLVARLFGHTESITSVAFSPDSQRVISTSKDATARIWHSATPLSPMVVKAHRGRARALFSDDGTMVASAGSDETVRLWDARSGSEIRTIQSAGAIGVALGKDGTLFVRSTSALELREASTGAEIARLADWRPDPFRVELRDPGLSPDGSIVATTGQRGDIHLSHSLDGSALRTLTGGQGQQVQDYLFNPDGSRFAALSLRGEITIWDVRSGASLKTMAPPLGEHAQRLAAFSPDGNLLLSLWGYPTIWDTRSGASVATLRRPRDRSEAAQKAYARDLMLGDTDLVNSAAFSPDGRLIVTASNDTTATIWDAADGAELRVLRGHTDQVLAASFSPDGSRVLTASKDGKAKLWDPEAGAEVATLHGHDGPVLTAEFSRDGTRIVTASEDGTVIIWDSVPYRARFLGTPSPAAVPQAPVVRGSSTQ